MDRVEKIRGRCLMRYAAQIIDAIREESSTNKKLEILRLHADDVTLKDLLFYTYNPFINYGIRKIPEYKPSIYPINNVPLRQALKRLQTHIVSRKFTGNKAIAFVKDILESLHIDDARMLECVLERNVHAGISTTSINKIWPDLIPTFKPMACEDYNEDWVKYPALLQEKMDGMRVLMFTEGNGNYTFFSRSGKTFDDQGKFAEFAKLFPKDRVIDGEFLVLDNKGKYLPRKKGNGICNKGIKGTISDDETSRLVFVIWDALTLNEFSNGSTSTTAQRFEVLTNFYNQRVNGSPLMKNVKLVKYEHVPNEKAVLKLFQEFTAAGGEGVIVKNLDQVWETRRSRGWLKLKIEKEMELRIVEVLEGLGKNLGRMGAVKCTDASGRLNVNIGTGFSDEQRIDIWERRKDLPGGIITVRYNEIIVDEDEGTMSLFLPRFLEERLDKTEPDDALKLLKTTK